MVDKLSQGENPELTSGGGKTVLQRVAISTVDRQQSDDRK